MSLSFTDLYSWCTSLGDKIVTGGENEEFIDYYTGYFVDTPVCRTVFLMGMAIAALIAALYYFGACNFVFRLAKRWVWLCVLVLVFLATLFATIPQIVGVCGDNIDNSTGIFKTAYDVADTKKDFVSDESATNEIEVLRQEFCDQFVAGEDSFMMSESLPLEMALANAVYASLLFIILSFVFKRFTIHGAAIPL